MRPVLSTIGSANHKISKVLDKFLQPFTVTKYTCNDVFEFTKEINEQKVTTSHYMVSFDVKSLFTMVPIEKTINICSRLFAEHYGQRDAILFEKLLRFATKNVNFLFNDDWYMQIDGVSMGSPVAPALANIFMNHIENRISEFTGAKPIYYKRYVDDISLIF